jgi:hypothetical protein
MNPDDPDDDLREPSHDEIAHLAYELYETRDHEHGYDLQDWLEAEQAIRAARRLDRRS